MEILAITPSQEIWHKRQRRTRMIAKKTLGQLKGPVHIFSQNQRVQKQLY